MKYFTHDAGNGAEWHDTPEQAATHAEGALTADREDASNDGWADDVEGTCWGVVLFQVAETKREPAVCDECCVETGEPHDPDCDEFEPTDPLRPFSAEFDYTADYDLRPVPGAVEAVLAMATDEQLHAELASRAAEAITDEGAGPLILERGQL